MVRIEDAATEYVTGYVNILLEKDDYRKDDLEFSLLISEHDKLKLMNIERNLSNKKEEERSLEDQNKVMKQIIKRSYEGKDDDWVSNIVTKYGNELLLEIYFMWKWRDKEAFKQANEIKKEMIQKIAAGQLDKKNN